MKTIVNKLAFVVTIVASLFLASCVTAESIVVNKPTSIPSVKPVRGMSSDEFLPFFVAFKKDGTPVIYSREGTPLDSRPLKFPLDTKKVYNIKTYTFGAVEGSCDMFWMYGGFTGITGFSPEVCEYFVPQQ
ncbi:MAG: hypothetical protein CMK89_04420 [Pseudomonadales bacterium]|nr:hypothetical protein [Pseudomonadales bacterium]